MAQITPPQLTSLQVVMYENDNSIILGLVLESKKNKYLILNDREREVELAPQRLFGLDGKVPAQLQKKSEQVAYLNTLHKEASALVTDRQVQELWEFITQEDPDKPQREYSDRELCELYFGKLGLAEQLGLRLAMMKEKTFFRRLQNTWEPRTADGVEQMCRAHEAEERKLLIQKDVVNFLRQRQKLTCEPSALIKPYIMLLEDVAAFGTSLEGHRLKEGEQLITMIRGELGIDVHGTLAEQAFYILKGCGHFNDLTNLHIIKYRPRSEFPSEVVNEEEKLRSILSEALIEQYIASSQSQIVDLTHLPTITIDDDSTKDMDDAFSIEQTLDGFNLYVHISHVASVITPGCHLDEEAKLRATSLYLPEITIPMLPLSLSDGLLSLVEGQRRLSVSLVAKLSSTYELIDFKFVESVIKVSERLSYNVVDQRLEKHDHMLEILHQMAARFEQRRIEGGAIKVGKREALIHVGADGSLKLSHIDESSPSRKLVGELMVLYNRLVSELLVQQKIPLPFRTQEASNDDEAGVLHSIPQGPAYDFAQRIRLKRSIVTTRPGLHATLGLKAYSQLSSPIRRYLDLVAQRQLVAFMRGLPIAYDQSSLEKEIGLTEDALQKGNLLSRDSKKYWMLKFLERRALRQPEIAGTIVRLDSKVTLVELDEIFLVFPVKLPYQFKLGDVLTLKITRVIAREDYLRLEVVS